MQTKVVCHQLNPLEEEGTSHTQLFQLADRPSGKSEKAVM